MKSTIAIVLLCGLACSSTQDNLDECTSSEDCSAAQPCCHQADTGAFRVCGQPDPSQPFRCGCRTSAAWGRAGDPPYFPPATSLRARVRSTNAALLQNGRR
jgi:hypothetical protein